MTQATESRQCHDQDPIPFPFRMPNEKVAVPFKAAEVDSDYRATLYGNLWSKIEALHDIGINHGDIGARNILYKKHGKDVQFVLSDFGFTKLRTEETNDDKALIDLYAYLGV